MTQVLKHFDAVLTRRYFIFFISKGHYLISSISQEQARLGSRERNVSSSNHYFAADDSLLLTIVRELP